MQECFEELLAPEARVVPSPTFKVVIVYGGFECGLRAMQLYERLTRKLAEDCPFELHLWNWEVLTMPSIASTAADAAAIADLVILTLAENGALPSRLKYWIDSWVEKELQHEAALVALFNPIRGPLEGSNAPWTYLVDVANRRGMKLFAGSLEMPCVLARLSTNGESQPVHRFRASLDQILVQTNTYAHWGLNE